MTISSDDYFGAKKNNPEATLEIKTHASDMLARVNSLLRRAAQDGAYSAPIDPDTGTCVSGARGGAGDGGFRLAASTTGAAKSLHKKGRAVDIYDPANVLDNWITNTILEAFALWRETPTKTLGWVHLQDKPPRSGNRTYMI